MEQQGELGMDEWEPCWGQHRPSMAGCALFTSSLSVLARKGLKLFNYRAFFVHINQALLCFITVVHFVQQF